MKKGGLLEFFGKKEFSESFGKLLFCFDRGANFFSYEKVESIESEGNIENHIRNMYIGLSSWESEMLPLAGLEEEEKKGIFANLLSGLKTWILALDSIEQAERKEQSDLEDNNDKNNNDNEDTNNNNDNNDDYPRRKGRIVYNLGRYFIIAFTTYIFFRKEKK